jgi:hypothetical protein
MEVEKMSGWLIALIIFAVLFISGGICCKTLGRAENNKKN